MPIDLNDYRIVNCGRIADDVVCMSVPCYDSSDPAKTPIKPHLYVPNGEFFNVGEGDVEEGFEEWPLPDGWQAALIWGGKHD